MPCYRCGTRQADPEPGKPSPWCRGLIGEHQVLICPDCQQGVIADLTRCARCGSVRLVRRLDQVECLDCHLARDASPDPGPAPAPDQEARDPGLAAEVARALQRILGAG